MKNFTIVETMTDRNLFATTFQSRRFRKDSWRAWRSFLAGLFALPMTSEAEEIFRRHTGRGAPTEPFRESFVIVGRRGGKSLVAALVATYLAAFRSYDDVLVPGEVGTLMVLAADRRQAQTIFGYIRGFFQTPMLRTMVVSELKESLTLNNRVVIEIHTCSYRTTRGFTLVGVVADELAFWRTEESANPAGEVLAALRPGLATTAGLLLGISSPYSKSGALYEAFREHYGKPNSPVLVWKATSREMNPTLNPLVVQAALLRDRAAASSEYLGEFRDDIGGFLSIEEIERVIARGRTLLPYIEGQKYKAFCDPSGGRNDSMVLAIAHGEKNRAVLDLVREVRAPFSPEEAVKEFSELLKAYRVSEVRGDRYSASWVSEAFERNRVRYLASDRSRSEIYLEFLPALTSGQLELLDNDRMKNQFAALERRTGAARDMVDHPVGGADDVANACAGAVVLALPSTQGTLGVIEWLKGIASGKYPHPDHPSEHAAFKKSTERNQDGTIPSAPQDGNCPQCKSTCVAKIGARRHCNACGLDFGSLPEVARVTRADALAGHNPRAQR
jgi:hypothetical protein